MTTVLRPRALATDASPVSWRAALSSLATPVTVIWAATALIAVRAPDMVTGSEHEHLPIAGITVWIWASLSTAYTAMAVRRVPPGPVLVLGVSLVWVMTALAAVYAPVMVTGSDPTRMPMAVLIGPVVAAVTTGFLALHHATTG